MYTYQFNPSIFENKPWPFLLIDTFYTRNDPELSGIKSPIFNNIYYTSIKKIPNENGFFSEFYIIKTVAVS